MEKPELRADYIRRIKARFLEEERLAVTLARLKDPGADAAIQQARATFRLLDER